MAELKSKDIQNNKEEVPFAHYEALFRALDPDEAALRCGVSFENGAFTVHFTDAGEAAYTVEFYDAAGALIGAVSDSIIVE